MVTFRLCCEQITSLGLVTRSAQCSSSHLIASQGTTVDLPVPVGPWIIIVLAPTVSDRSCFAFSARLAIPLRVALNRSTKFCVPLRNEYPEPQPSSWPFLTVWHAASPPPRPLPGRGGGGGAGQGPHRLRVWHRLCRRNDNRLLLNHPPFRLF